MTVWWKERAVYAKSKGYPDIVCAQWARVSLGQLQTEFANDEAFRIQYEEAAQSGARPPQC